jgi:uncharacterized membrane protein
MDALMQQAKQPRTPIAGSYGHPVHPIIVTLPIGAWVCAFLFDLVSFFAAGPRGFSRGAMWLILIGVIGAAFAAIWGTIDLLRIPRGTTTFRTGQIHAALNSTALVVFLLSFIWRYATRGSWSSSPVGPFILVIIGLAIVGVSGFLGGKLAYRYGVRVADEGTQAEGYGRAAGRAVTGTDTSATPRVGS